MQNKTFCTFNNNKPWFTAELRRLRQDKEEAYRSGDRDLYKQARNKLTKEIKAAKRNYSVKLKERFSANDSSAVWKGLQTITNYRRPSPHPVGSPRLAEDLNDFFSRFENKYLVTSNKEDLWLSQTCNFFFKKLFCPPLVTCINGTCLNSLSV